MTNYRKVVKVGTTTNGDNFDIEYVLRQSGLHESWQWLRTTIRKSGF